MNKGAFYPAAVFIIISGVSACKQSPLTEQEAIKAINSFDAGWNHKNVHMVDSVLAKGYTYFTQSGSTFSRDSVVATAGENSYSLSDVTRTEYQVTLDNNVAIVSTRWKGKGMYRGIAFNEDQRCSITVIKKGDSVKILSEHCTPIKAMRIFH